MKGVVFTGNRNLELQSFADPRPGPGDVVIEIKASGFCGSDLHHYRGPKGASMMGKSAAFLAEHGLTLDDPIIAGHEPCGVVAEVGQHVDPRLFRPGDRVMVYHYDGCRHCNPCRTGWVQMCDRGATVFGHTAHGGHAPYMRVPAQALIHLPDDIGFLAGSAISCGAGTAYAAIERVGLSARDTLAVFGLGPVGQSAIQFAQAMGVRTLAVDVSPARLETARRFGASEVLQAGTDDVVARVMAWTGGRGADVALECSGSEQARQSAVRCTSNWGRIAMVGVGGGLSLDVWPDLMVHQRTIFGHWTFSDAGMSRCVRFVADHGIDLERQFSDRWTLEDAEQAYRQFDQQSSGKACFVF